jgi:hypothetical protein
MLYLGRKTPQKTTNIPTLLILLLQDKLCNISVIIQTKD